MVVVVQPEDEEHVLHQRQQMERRRVIFVWVGAFLSLVLGGFGVVALLLLTLFPLDNSMPDEILPGGEYGGGGGGGGSGYREIVERGPFLGPNGSSGEWFFLYANFESDIGFHDDGTRRQAVPLFYTASIWSLSMPLSCRPLVVTNNRN